MATTAELYQRLKKGAGLGKTTLSEKAKPQELYNRVRTGAGLQPVPVGKTFKASGGGGGGSTVPTTTQPTTQPSTQTTIASIVLPSAYVETPEEKRKKQAEIYNRVKAGMGFGKTTLSKGVYTPQEYAQKLSEERKSWDIEYQKRQTYRESLKKSISEIEPSAQYQYGTLTTKGVWLKPMLEQELTKLDESDIGFQKGYSAFQIQQVQALNMPPSTKVKQTGLGYEFQRDLLAESRAEWKTLSPVQQFGKSLWVGATQWPGIVWGGFLDIQKHQENLIKQENIQWSKAKERDFGYITKEALLSPAMVEAYTGAVAVGVGKLAPVVARGTIKGGVKLYSRFSPSIPKGNVFMKGLGKISETTIGKRAIQWSTKGYKWGTSLKTGAVPVRETVEQGMFKSEKITSRIIESKLGRTWLSPEAFKTAEKTLKNRLGKSISIGFPKSEGEMSTIIKSSRMGGLMGNKIITKQITHYTGFVKPPPLESTGIFNIRNVLPVSSGGLTPSKSSWFREVGEYHSLLNLGNKPFQAVKNVWFIPEKKWHLVALGKKSLRPSLFGSKEATMGLTTQLEKSIYTPSRKALTSMGIHTTIPSGGASGLMPMLYGTTKLGSTVLTSEKRIQPVIPSMEKERTGFTPITLSSFKQLDRQLQNQLQTQATRQNEITLFSYKQAQAQKTVLKQIQKQITSTHTAQTQDFKNITTSRIGFPPVIPGLPRLYGRGTQGAGGGYKGYSYKLRTKKMGLPFDMVDKRLRKTNDDLIKKMKKKLKI